jgi:hypothetical protein
LNEHRALREWLKQRPNDGSDYLFTSQKGGRLDRSQFFRLFRAIAGEAGLPAEKRHPHALKTFARQSPGFRERQSRPGETAARPQVDRFNNAVCEHDRPASLKSDGERADDDLLSRILVVRKLLNPLQQFCRFQVEGRCECLEGSQANLLAPCLQIRHVVFVDSGLLCQVDLPPSAIRPQLTNSLTKRNADVRSHPYYSGDRITGASTLSCGGNGVTSS